MPFRGKNKIVGKPLSGKFLGTIGILSQIETFLGEYLKLYANNGSGTTSYLSKTIYEELIVWYRKVKKAHIK